MNSLSILAALLFWATPQLASGPSVTGTIRLIAGAPAAGVKVMAMAVPGAGRQVNRTYVAERITQTDSEGHYRLEDLSPGRYLIAAGPLTSPTFHPGTLEQNAASVLTVTREGRTLTGIDFSLKTFSPSGSAAFGYNVPLALFGGLNCCRFTGKVVSEDGKPFPIVNLKIVSGGNSNLVREDGTFNLSVPIGSPARFELEGLPPGYVLKSVVLGGNDVGLGPVPIDGKSLATLDLTLGYLATSATKVTARGKVDNIARELGGTNLSLTSTNPSGPTIAAPLRADGSFEFAAIPIGVYLAGVLNAAGNTYVSSSLVVIRDAVSDLKIEFRNNPFPDFEDSNPARSPFADGKESKITGVVTQRLTPVGDRGRSMYFRVDVKNESTGVVTPWAVYVAQEWHVPKIVVGETLTVPGILSTDGTTRLYVSPF